MANENFFQKLGTLFKKSKSILDEKSSCGESEEESDDSESEKAGGHKHKH